MNKRIIILYVVLFVFFAGCAHHQNISTAVNVESSYKDYVLPSLPAWTNKYAHMEKGDRSFFMISELVKKENLTRLQAIELQNHFRDLTAAGMSSPAAFDQALKKVRDFDFESKLDRELLDKAPFIVAIDMDETLLQQYYSKWKDGPGFYDYLIQFDGGQRGVSMTPGWQFLLEKIKELGGLVVIFSANEDATVWKIVDTVVIAGKKLSSYADGIMTNNYLILQGKNEWQKSGKLGDPVVAPSKDLRLLDESLDKVIIIDDNPKRIIQQNRLRLPKKYQADLYFETGLEVVHDAYRAQLISIAKEIEESVSYGKENNLAFSRAYLPYTQLGQVAMKWIMQNKAMTFEQAREYIRQNPKVVDQKF